MDIFKILTRGIKQAPAKTSDAQTPSSTDLPSAGGRTHPQLFHDHAGPSKGTKRKRNNKEAQDTLETADDSELDFFASKKEAPGDDQSNPTVDHQPVPQPKKRKIKLLDEDECRDILRSHRLKLTLLAGRSEKPAKTSSKKKDGKRKKEKAAKAETKDEKRQIYPQPLRSFPELQNTYGIPQQLAENIAKQGFREPTEVQMGSLPLLLDPKTALKSSRVDDVDVGNGTDFMGVAPTGSGKTISFLIPAITRVLQRRADETTTDSDGHELDAIIVAPTRELASQIVNEGRKLAVGTGVRIYLMRKSLHIATEDVKKDEESSADRASDSDAETDPSSSDQDSDRNAPQSKADKPQTPEKRAARPDIIVATPKSLLNFLSGGKTKPRKLLPSVTSLVLDEADVLLDPIFQKQTLAIWGACTNPDLNLTFWSATMASNVESVITKQTTKRANQLRLPQRPLVRLVVGLKGTAVPNITHKLVYTATEPGKLLALRQLLHPVSGTDSGPPLRPPFLVFTQTIERAQALHDELKYDIPLEAGGPARLAVLHSALAERARAAVMARFRAGDVWVLITTDVLARGVDFAGVNGVVSYDVPTSPAAYVHRAGRTGRAGRRGGVAVTFYTKEDIPFVKSVANVIVASERQARGAATSSSASGQGKKNDDWDEDAAVQKWLLDALPKVSKEDKRRLKVRGVEVRRSGGKADISTKSSWEKRKENNRRGAIEASKRRKREQQRQEGRLGSGGGQGQPGSDSEWGGFGE